MSVFPALNARAGEARVTKRVARAAKDMEARILKECKGWRKWGEGGESRKRARWWKERER